MRICFNAFAEVQLLVVEVCPSRCFAHFLFLFFFSSSSLRFPGERILLKWVSVIVTLSLSFAEIREAKNLLKFPKLDLFQHHFFFLAYFLRLFSFSVGSIFVSSFGLNSLWNELSSQRDSVLKLVALKAFTKSLQIRFVLLTENIWTYLITRDFRVKEGYYNE